MSPDAPENICESAHFESESDGSATKKEAALNLGAPGSTKSAERQKAEVVE